MDLHKWPILNHTEETQSNTYIPLICSVIKGFNMDFPKGYEFEFYAAVQEYNHTPGIGPPLPFTNLKTFQDFLKNRVSRVIHGLSIVHFHKACDDSFHVRPDIQDEIMHGLDGFFNIFIDKLIKFGRKHNVTCNLRFEDAPREDTREEIARREAYHREFERETAERLEREGPHKADARAGIEAAQREHPDRTVTDKWYVVGDGVQEDYSDEVNRQINEHLGSGKPPFMTNINKQTYLIDTKNSMEENLKTGQRRLVLKKPRWYYKNGEELIPFSDEDNRKIVNGLTSPSGVSLENHEVYPNARIRVNRNTDLIDTIVYEGGNKKTKRNKRNKKTKRRRSICVSRRHA
jgi:hypothetical protein